MLLRFVVEGKIKSNLQISEAVSYLKKLPTGTHVSLISSAER